MYYVSTTGNNSNDGGVQTPWGTINFAISKLQPGDTLCITAGLYCENIEMDNISGTTSAPIRIVGEGAVLIDGGGNDTAFSITNCENIIIEGLSVTNAHNGIDVRSNAERGDRPLRHIIIKDNIVYGIDGPEGGHAISVYGANPFAPIVALVIEGNKVHNNKLYWSEALVVNGNIDGFIISDNVVWNNDNIGIDIIGFEGTAGENPDVDCARNGKVYNNIVFGSDTTGNEAYWSANHNVQGEVWTGRDEGPFLGKYDRCCGGIYVDGGWHIEIYNNFVFDNDLGIEVATEHKPPLVTKDVHVHDNIIASSTGWAGLIFGGYASHLGYTVDCSFKRNILYDNESSIAVQKSKNNIIEKNVIVGGWAAIDFNGDMANNNTFGVNYWENLNNDDEYYDVLNELPKEQVDVQVMASGLIANPAEGDFTLNVPEGFGTKWRPCAQYLELYAKFVKAQAVANKAVEFLHTVTIPAGIKQDEICTALTDILAQNGFEGTSVKAVLKVSKAQDLFMLQVATMYGEDMYAQATTVDGVRKSIAV